jgi:hypothetical protein
MIVRGHAYDLLGYKTNSNPDSYCDDERLKEPPTWAARLSTHTKRDVRVTELVLVQRVVGAIVVRWSGTATSCSRLGHRCRCRRSCL